MRSFKCVFLTTSLFARSAFALSPQDWTVHSTILADENSASYMPYGPGGGIAVTRDHSSDEYVMIAEFRSNASPGNCTRGVWGLAGARSEDGVNWTWFDEPIYLPTPGSGAPYECVMAHPATIWAEELGGSGRPDYSTLTIFFKAEDDTSPYYRGFGLAELEFLGNGDPKDFTIASNLLIAETDYLGYINVLQLDDAANDNPYMMLIQIGPEIYRSTSTSLTTGWSSPALIMQPGDANWNYTWNQDQLANPELMCLANGNIQGFIGGQTWTSTPFDIDEAAWAPATSTDGGETWSWPDNPQVTWSGNDQMRHWSPMRWVNPGAGGSGGSGYVVWFTEKDNGGNLQVRVMYTTLAPENVNPDNLLDRRCGVGN